MNELALFAGAGGGILGGHLLGWRTVCAVEWEPYPASVLMQRQNEGVFAPFPIWDDVRTFDGRPWRGRVDVVSGGFPCQDISAAGKGAGINGERSGMWGHMARIIREVGPRFAFVENSPMLTSRGLGRVLGDLAAMGYDAEWGVLGAVHAGAPHKRDRIWIVGTLAKAMPIGERREQRQGQDEGDALANADRVRKLQSEGHESDERGRTGNSSETLADTMRDRPQGQREDGDAAGSVGLCSRTGSNQIEHLRDTPGEGLPLGIARAMGRPRPLSESERSSWWATEPDVGRVAHGVAARVDRLKAIGNGQVSGVAALAWRILSK
jgi:DNA (cytosine-5)-methyltransferase 1